MKEENAQYIATKTRKKHEIVAVKEENAQYIATKARKKHEIVAVKRKMPNT